MDGQVGKERTWGTQGADCPGSRVGQVMPVTSTARSSYAFQSNVTRTLPKTPKAPIISIAASKPLAASQSPCEWQHLLEQTGLFIAQFQLGKAYHRLRLTANGRTDTSGRAKLRNRFCRVQMKKSQTCDTQVWLDFLELGLPSPIIGLVPRLPGVGYRGAAAVADDSRS